MKVTVKYFGLIAEATGTAEEVLDLAQIGTDVQALRGYCIEKYGLADDASLRIAVNQLLRQEGALQAGDEVAFLPPFAGG